MNCSREVADASRFASKGKIAPLDGVALKGLVVATVVGMRSMTKASFE